MFIRFWQFTIPVAALLLLAACDETSESEYLEDEIPPCTAVPGSAVDPCDPDAKRISFRIGHPDERGIDAPTSVRDMLRADSPLPAWVPHFVLRGTYLPGTGRCTAGDPFRPPGYLHSEFGYDTSTEWSVKCYMDVRANAYLIGSGPPSFTALLLRWQGLGGTSTEEDREHMEDLRTLFEYIVNALFPGREHVTFFGPPVDLSSEAWRLLGYWDLQRQDGTVIVEHPQSDRLVMELPEFIEAVTTAHQERLTEYGGRIGADASLPMLVTDVHQLREYYNEVGAYASGTPAPAQPPPLYPKAEVGKEYPYRLIANCALFDGRFWIADPPLHDGKGVLLPEWQPPPTKGVMVLVREDTAVFTARSGQIAEFVPLPPEVELDDDTCALP